jgi:hypothetical protein
VRDIKNQKGNLSTEASVANVEKEKHYGNLESYFQRTSLGFVRITTPDAASLTDYRSPVPKRVSIIYTSSKYF